MNLTSKQKNEIIQYIKEFVEKEGSIRVGYAIVQKTEQKVAKHEIEKIANTIIQSGEYLKEPAAKDYFDINIFKNPDYKPKTWIERNPIWFEIIKGLIFAIFSIVVSVILSLSIFQKTQEKKESEKIESNKK
jgi:hypothetical protein